MKIYQYDVRKGNKIETVVVVPYTSDSRIKEIANDHLQNADEVIMTVWENGAKVETKSFVKEVIENAETPEIKTFENSSELFAWYCKPAYGTVSCQLAEGSRPVKKKVFKDEIGEHIKIGKVKIYV